MDKAESRALSDLKHDYEVRIEAQENALRTKEEEVDYQARKVAKLEAENKQLRVQKPSVQAEKQIEELKKEIYLLKLRGGETQKEAKPSASSKELEELEMLIQGYQKENERQT